MGKATPNISLPALGESLEQVDEAQSLSGDQITELDRRLDELDADGPVGLTWDEVIAKVRVM